jgi:hypothetical protein
VHDKTFFYLAYEGYRQHSVCLYIWFRGTKPEPGIGDVDVMVIGRAGLADLSPALRKAEKRLGREVNVTACSPEELQEKVKSHDHFDTAVLRGRRQFIEGDQSDWTKLSAIIKKPRDTRPPKRSGITCGC